MLYYSSSAAVVVLRPGTPLIAPREIGTSMCRLYITHSWCRVLRSAATATRQQASPLNSADSIPHHEDPLGRDAAPCLAPANEGSLAFMTNFFFFFLFLDKGHGERAQNICELSLHV